ncbi:MAG: polysaccharide biosynthesis protein [Gammaproteobacteria bacterium]
MSSFFIKISKRVIVFSYDFFTIPIAWFLGYWLRFNLSYIPDNFFSQGLILLGPLFIIQIACYLLFGLYRGIWRFASLPDLIRIIKAISVASLTMLVLTAMLVRLHNVPRSIFPLYALLSICILGGGRLCYRWLKSYLHDFSSAKRVLIIGAGTAGESLIRDLIRDVNHAYLPVVLLDDDSKKQGLEIHGVRVVGNIQDLQRIVIEYKIEFIFIAIPTATSASMRKVVELCEKTNLPFRTLPGLNDLASGNVTINALREVSIEDLLGRESVSLDWQSISNKLYQKTILVTGAGGSIGSELCRQIVKLNPKELLLLDNSEYNLYKLDYEFKNQFPHLIFQTYLVDVTDEIAIKNILSQHKPKIIFHAAAYKHVPILESNIRSAIQNNILGTWVVAQEAVKHGVEIFTLISTDKAVNPTNVMGASKRAAEIICQNFNKRSKTHFVTVRFGNVLGSTGSVVPLFKKQISMGGPVTVTHPEISRFFMTIPEATQLILQATVIAEGGEIFVLDMGEPIKIDYLAHQMIQLAGLRVNEDIKIVYTGLRPGEKLHEELFHENEALICTKHEKIQLANYRSLDWDVLDRTMTVIIQALENSSNDVLLKLLNTIVPEWKIRDRHQAKALEFS